MLGQGSTWIGDRLRTPGTAVLVGISIQPSGQLTVLDLTCYTSGSKNFTDSVSIQIQPVQVGSKTFGGKVTREDR